MPDTRELSRRTDTRDVTAAGRLPDDDRGGPGPGGPPPEGTGGPTGEDQDTRTSQRHRTVRSWPLLVLAAPAAAEVWSGWVGIAQMTGFGRVALLPGIYPSLHLDTTVALPVGVEAYAAYALRAWLSAEPWISSRTRRFARRSAIFSFALGMAGQVAYHLLAQAQVVRAPWPVTMFVSCLPVLVLAMGTALAHMLRADADPGPGHAAVQGPNGTWSQDQAQAEAGGTDRQVRVGSSRQGPPYAGTRSFSGTRPLNVPGNRDATMTTEGGTHADHALLVARRLAAAGMPVTRRALRSAGIRGSNQSLNALARRIRTEFAAAGST